MFQDLNCALELNDDCLYKSFEIGLDMTFEIGLYMPVVIGQAFINV